MGSEVSRRGDGSIFLLPSLYNIELTYQKGLTVSREKRALGGAEELTEREEIFIIALRSEGNQEGEVMREMVLPRVRQAIHKHHLLTPGERVVVAVSGGADSVVLLHCLLRLRDEFSLSLHAAHLDHGLRKTSHQDAAFVHALAASWGLPATIGPLGQALSGNRSPQAAARQARYRFLQEVALQIGATKIALGHHRDDQAETVLLNLLRGSGLRGLRGMLAIREGRIIRPLLGVGRDEIEAYAKRHHLSFLEDPSNRDPRFLRNRIRYQLLPLLQREYNPSISKTLAKTAELLAEEEAYVEGTVEQISRRPLFSVQGNRICMGVGVLRGLASPIRRRLLERAIRAVAPKGYLTSTHLEAVERLLQPKGASAVTLPLGRSAWRSGDLLYLGWREKGEGFLFNRELQVPGEVELPELGMTVKAGIMPRSVIDLKEGNPDRAYADWDQVLPPLRIRNWRPGDRFRPWGLKGSKKLQDLFVDAKIPREDRGRVPIITDRKGILWVPGFRIDERGGIRGATERVVVFSIHRGGGPSPA
jgi:tRNA(Ile)-lysidine synthase